MRYFEVITESKDDRHFLMASLSKETVNNLIDYCEEYYIDNPIHLDEDHDTFHVTIIDYPKDSGIDISPIDFEDLEVTGKHFSYFGDDKNVLVLEIESPQLTKRHNDLKKKYGITPTFPEYKPHITLSYDTDVDIDELELPDFSIKVSKESVDSVLTESVYSMFANDMNPRSKYFFMNKLVPWYEEKLNDPVHSNDMYSRMLNDAIKYLEKHLPPSSIDELFDKLGYGETFGLLEANDAYYAEKYDILLDTIANEESKKFFLEILVPWYEKTNPLKPHYETDKKYFSAGINYLRKNSPPPSSLDELFDIIETGEPKRGPQVSKLVNVKTPNFKQWFGNSKAVDNRGRPLVFYRGTQKTPKADKFGTKRSAPSFTPFADIASIYSSSVKGMFDSQAFNTGATVTPVFLSVQNPLDLRSYGDKMSFTELFHEFKNMDWANESDIEWLMDVVSDLRRLARTVLFNYELSGPPSSVYVPKLDDYSQLLYDTWEECNDKNDFDDITYMLDDSECDVYAIVDSPTFLSKVKDCGYDAVVHLDVFTAGKEMVSLLGKDEVEGIDADDFHDTWRVWKSTQIKSIFNKGTWSSEEGSSINEKEGN